MLKKSLTIFLSLIFVFSALPLTSYAAEVEEITLAVSNGDDISDAFIDAARLAKNDESGKIYKITIPAGSYTASSQLKLWSNTYLYMNGVTITRTASFNMLRFGNESDLNATAYNAFNNIRIEGGTFNGGAFNGKAIMQIGHSKNVTLKNVNFCNVKNAHMVEMGGCSDINIEGCTFRDFTGTWDTTTNREALQFEIVTTRGKHFSGYPDNNDETPCKNITVKGCTFKNLQRGIGSHTAIINSYFTNMVFENNVFENITGFAVIATNYSNSKINNNVIKNCGSGILFNSFLKSNENFYTSTKHSNSRSSYANLNTQINNNNINVTTGYMANYKNVAYGIQLSGEKYTSAKGGIPAGDYRCAGVSIRNNKINLGCTGYGIWLIGAVGNVVSNNVINCNLAKKGKGGNGDGIRMQESSNNTVSSNTITNSTTSGYDKELCGITVSENSVSNSFMQNKITKAKKDGFRIDSSKGNKFSDNTVTSAGRDGFHSEKSASLTFTSNKIKKCRVGIGLKSSKSAKLKKNKISGSKNDGIKLEKSPSATINKNTITSSKRDGINITSSKKIKLTSNKIKSCKRYGINAKKSFIKKDKKNSIKKCKRKARSWK